MNDEKDKTDEQNKGITLETAALFYSSTLNNSLGTSGMPETSGIILPFIISILDKDNEKQGR